MIDAPRWQLRRSPPCVPLLAAALLGPAVVPAAAAGQPAHVSVRDSAGVEIVDNGDGRVWPEGGAWRVSDAPDLEIGSVAGPQATRLHRVTDAVRLSDGRVVVANAGSGELRWFDARGRPLGGAGGAGGGPSEFTPTVAGGTALVELGRLAGDTVAAFDASARDVLVFGPEGRFARSVPLEAPPGGSGPTLEPVGWTEEGGLVVTATSFEGLETGSGAGVRRGEATLLFYRPDGRLDRVGRSYPGPEMYLNIGSRDESGRFSVSILSMDPFLRKLAGDAAGGRVAVGATDRYSFDVYGPDGRLLRVVRGPAGPEPLEEDDVEAWLERELEDADDPGRRERYRRAADPSVLPDSLPAFGALLVDAGGRVWVREHRPPGAREADDPSRWSVYGRRGRRLGEVALPAGLEPFEVGDDYVLGRWRGAMDVERVRLHRLRKPGPGPGNP